MHSHVLSSQKQRRYVRPNAGARKSVGWRKLDDNANGGVAVALDEAEAEVWGGTTNGDWAPVLLVYVRVDSG